VVLGSSSFLSPAESFPFRGDDLAVGERGDGTASYAAVRGGLAFKLGCACLASTVCYAAFARLASLPLRRALQLSIGAVVFSL
jgi:hypothetical protein